jgi:hypothetical protein
VLSATLIAARQGLADSIHAGFVVTLAALALVIPVALLMGDVRLEGKSGLQAE